MLYAGMGLRADYNLSQSDGVINNFSANNTPGLGKRVARDSSLGSEVLFSSGQCEPVTDPAAGHDG